MINLRVLPDTLDLHGKRVLLRLDWNVPLGGDFGPEDTVKIRQSLTTIRLLRQRGAIVIILTHLGRPEGREAKYSTKQLVSVLEHRFRLSVAFNSEAISSSASRKRLVAELADAEPRSVHLLENVRFESGEENDDVTLAKAYAEIGDVFINDAFASSHRAHVSVSGIAKLLPSFAGPQLIEEATAASRLIEKPRAPFVVIIGGLKLSTKIPVLKTLLPLCDRMLIGGAMANTLAGSIGMPVGRSFVEKELFAQAKKIARDPKVVLPVDVVVTTKPDDDDDFRSVAVEAIEPTDVVVDVGPKTLAQWGKDIARAKTILWNGPVGKSEIPAFGSGSRFLARTIALAPKDRLFSVIGGGDTLPIIYKTKTQDAFSHVSMGGGALLEFLAKNGQLPGLRPLIRRKDV